MNAQGMILLAILMAVSVVIFFFRGKKKNKKTSIKKQENIIVVAHNFKYFAKAEVFACEFNDGSCQKYGYCQHLLTPAMEESVKSGEETFLHLKCEMLFLDSANDICRWLVKPLEEIKQPQSRVSRA